MAPSTTTRQRYLESIVDLIVAEGRCDLTLSEFAEAAGTSDRMLVYYFKSREGLFGEAVDGVRARCRRAFASTLAELVDDDPQTVAAALRAFAHPDRRTSILFVHDVATRSLAGEVPFGELHERIARDAAEEAEVSALRVGADQANAQAFGTLFASLGPALGADLIATGDTERVDNAIASAADLLATLLAAATVDLTDITTPSAPAEA